MTDALPDTPSTPRLSAGSSSDSLSPAPLSRESSSSSSIAGVKKLSQLERGTIDAYDSTTNKVTQVAIHEFAAFKGVFGFIRKLWGEFVPLRVEGQMRLVKISELSKAMGIEPAQLQQAGKLEKTIHNLNIQKAKTEKLAKETLTPEQLSKLDEPSSDSGKLLKLMHAFVKLPSSITKTMSTESYKKLVQAYETGDPAKAEERRTTILTILGSIGEQLAEHQGDKEVHVESEDGSLNYLISKDKEVYIEMGKLGGGTNKEAVRALHLKSGRDVAWVRPHAGAPKDMIADIATDTERHEFLHSLGVRHLLPLAETRSKTLQELQKQNPDQPIEQLESFHLISEIGQTADNLTVTSDFGTKLDVFIDVAETLIDFHDLGVIHRDLKPENIMLNKGEGCVFDLGTLTAIGEKAPPGTPEYQPPRPPPQIIPKNASAPASSSASPVPKDVHSEASYDTFSFGVVMFQMITGKNKPVFEKNGEMMSFNQLKTQGEIDAVIKAEVEKISLSETDKGKKKEECVKLRNARENLLKKATIDPNTNRSRGANFSAISPEEFEAANFQIKEGETPYKAEVRLRLLIDTLKNEENSYNAIAFKTPAEKRKAIETLQRVCKGLMAIKLPEKIGDPPHEDLGLPLSEPDFTSTDRPRLNIRWAKAELDRIRGKARVLRET